LRRSPQQIEGVFMDKIMKVVEITKKGKDTYITFKVEGFLWKDLEELEKFGLLLKKEQKK